MTELHESQTSCSVRRLATMQRLGGNTLLVDEDNQLRKLRSVRVGNIMLQDWPVDEARPREIYTYWVEGDKHRKIEPSKCLYCLQGNTADTRLTSICSSSISC